MKFDVDYPNVLKGENIDSILENINRKREHGKQQTQDGGKPNEQ